MEVGKRRKMRDREEERETMVKKVGQEHDGKRGRRAR